MSFKDLTAAQNIALKNKGGDKPAISTDGKAAEPARKPASGAPAKG